MTAFKVAHVAADDWAHAAKGCVDNLGALPAGANLGFLFVTDALADGVSSILTYVRQRTGITDWVGCVGMGVSAADTEYFDSPAAAVMVGALPPDSFRVFPALSQSAGEIPVDCREWLARVSAPFGIVHGDPQHPATPDIIRELGEMTSGFLIGGLCSSRTERHQIAGRLTGGGVSGILFSPAVEVATGLSQGCTPVASSHVISDCLDNVIIGLDGRRALDVLKEDVGELLARDLSRAMGYIHAALPIEGSDVGDYLVRNLMGIDGVRGWIGIGAELRPGDRVGFVRRDPNSARADLNGMLKRLKARLPGPPKGALYYSCVARGANMFGAAGVELALIRAALGEVPVLGFAAGGEVSNGRLYSYTGVIAVFL